MSLPNPKWLLLESPRFGLSLIDYINPSKNKFSDLPPGEGQPVYLLPGFATNHFSTTFIQRILKRNKYSAYNWNYGWNVRFDETLIEHIKRELFDLYDAYEEPVSVIGLSLGGTYARFLANYAPEKVRQVITLGSPINGKEPLITYGSYLYDFINKDQCSHQLLEKYGGMIHANPAVPSTAIYTKSDGVVHWKYCVQKETEIAENIEVKCSHAGLACNPEVIRIICDRLSQEPSNWLPYKQ